MPLASRLDSRAGRFYFAFQASAGSIWWISVFMSDSIRRLTLGDLDPVVVAWFDVPLFVIASALVAGGLHRLVWVVAPWTALVTAGMALYATATGTAGWGVLLMTAATVGSAAAGLLLVLGRLPSEWILFGPFAFTLAPAGSRGAHVVRTMVQVVIFWALFLAVFPAVIAFLEHRWSLHVAFPGALRWGGVILLIVASALGIWSAITMSTRGDGTPLPSATARRLVVAGPYRFVRNPMALAGIAQGVAVGMLASSWLVIAYALSGSLVWNAIVRPLEEADLSSRFGRAYDEYAGAVRCWVPRTCPFRGTHATVR